MNLAPGPKGVLVLLGLCLLCDANFDRVDSAVQRNKAHQAAAAYEAEKLRPELRRLAAGDAEAAVLEGLFDEAARAAQKRGTAAAADLKRIAAPFFWLTFLLHAALLIGTALMLVRHLPDGEAAPVFVGGALSSLPFVVMFLAVVFGMRGRGPAPEIILMAVVALLTAAVVVFLDDAFPFLRRVKTAFRTAWPLMMTSWVFVGLAYLEGPFFWLTLVYLAATAILTPVEYALAKEKAVRRPEAVLPRARAELMY